MCEDVHERSRVSPGMNWIRYLGFIVQERPTSEKQRAEFVYCATAIKSHVTHMDTHGCNPYPFLSHENTF